MRPELAPAAKLWQGRASSERGRLAQLVERLVYTEDVGGSSPSSPTIQSLFGWNRRTVEVCFLIIPPLIRCLPPTRA